MQSMVLGDFQNRVYLGMMSGRVLRVLAFAQVCVRVSV
jgi:hypothetical protein